VTSEHLSLETLSDYTDDLLTLADRDAVERHLASCVACAGQQSGLRTLLEASRALPPMAPPPELWGDIRTTIVDHRLPRRPTSTSWWQQRGLLAAAAVLLVVASSAVTATIMRQRAPAAGASTQAPVATAVPSLPASMRAIEADYVGTATELRDALAAQRSQLAPATIVKVEASLRVIDDAIAEARRALVQDPANRTLLDIFSSNYRQKLELLRRAAELPAAT
jgi:hypothetical protein